MNTDRPSQEVQAAVEAMMRRVKRALYWNTTRDTADLVRNLLEQWISDFDDISQNEKNIYESARRYIIEYLQRRENVRSIHSAQTIAEAFLPTEDDLRELIADAEVLAFVRREVTLLEHGDIHREHRRFLTSSEQTAQVLRMTMDGMRNPEIAKKINIDVDTAGRLLQEGCAYLTALLFRK